MGINLYAHGGSKNHGCEALVRSTCKICNNDKITTFSSNPEEDEKYGISKICNISKDGLTRYDKPLKWFVYSVLCRLKLLEYAKKHYLYLRQNIATKLGR